MDARSLRCPQCGAATRTGAARCPYCRARLATVSCPGCLGLMFEEAEFCGNCGARRARQAEPSAAKCPGCRGALQAVTVGAVSLLECAACDGLWVDASAFERICADRETQSAVVHWQGRAHTGGRKTREFPAVRSGRHDDESRDFARLSGTIGEL